MKKTTLPFLILLLLCTTALAQNVIPNGSFETWISGTNLTPKYSVQNSNPSLFYSNADSLNCQRVTDAYHGSYAVKLNTVVVTSSDTIAGFFINGNPSNNKPAGWTGGIPISAIPTGASGYYKSAISAGDSGFVIFDFRSGGVSVGVYSYKFTGTQTAYTPFFFTFNPPISVTPDSVIFGASSSDIINHIMVPGSMLQLDDISLTGLTNQPVQLNGDFELWDSTTLLKPDSWFDPSNQYIGITRTTDAETGTYAIELKTTAGNRNNQQQAIPAVLSNGFFDCAKGSGPCMPGGGSPYSGTTADTLAFYYKYVPTANDTAEVLLSFIKNGIVIGGISPVQLLQSNNYQYIEIPFFIGLTPDTEIITFQSSVNGDSLTAYAGSDLKIDDLHFKTKVVLPSGVKNISAEEQLLIYPNPSSDGTFIISGTEQGEQFRVFNMLGQEVNAVVTNKTGSYMVIQMPANAKGIYFVEVSSKNKIITCKITISR
jgi:hypothetical protein